MTAMGSKNPFASGQAANLRIWLADLTYTQQTVAADVMPNAIGGIATFSEAQVPLKTPIRLFKYPERLAAALEQEGPPDILGFSNYIWNSNLSYGFAQAIKRVNPKAVIVFGGPNYPVNRTEQEIWLRRWKAVDFAIIKEGELAFTRLVEALIETQGDIEAVKRRALPSVHAIASDGMAILTNEVERIRELTQIPSPYTSGRMDEFFDGVLLPIIQTNRGCPFGCTFCVEGVRYYNKVYRNAEEKVGAELDYIGRKMQTLRSKGGRNDLFIADSNFGMYAEDLDTCRALARTRAEYQWPEYINVATGKNKKERVLEASRIIDGALRLSGSVQSLDPKVLENIQRNNISADGLMDLGLKAGEIGANTYSEVILALPGDSLKAHFNTVRTVIEAGFTNIYLFQLMLLPGTEVASEESKARFGMTTRYRVLPRCYGYFNVLGEELRTAEIEEICVANNTLSFEDYLACRRMHLVVTLFYNDGIFSTLLKLIRMLNLPIFRWLQTMLEAEIPPGLDELFASFLNATKDELWENKADLEAFVAGPGIAEKLIAGELGNNLLFVHKTLGITRHIGDLAQFARAALLRCLEEAGKADAETIAFIDEALAYHCCRAQNLFFERDVEPTAALRYDIPAFEKTLHPDGLSEFRFDAPRPYRFLMDESQKTLIERYLAIYGATPVGIGRILSKVFVRKLFRHPVPDDGTELGPMIQRTGEIEFHLAGLQN
jgi:radical SAM superfamily enzyme YgiQ (UPF0313 family)